MGWGVDWAGAGLAGAGLGEAPDCWPLSRVYQTACPLSRTGWGEVAILTAVVCGERVVSAARPPKNLAERTQSDTRPE